MKRIVMVDEKWFYKFQQGQKYRYYLSQDEELPVAKVQHKSHIQKVMFLAAVARPRHDTGRNRNFSGKIGIFPFTLRVQAQRSSRNRRAGELETKTVEVTKEVYKRKTRSFPPSRACGLRRQATFWCSRTTHRPIASTTTRKYTSFVTSTVFVSSSPARLFLLLR